MPRPAHRHSRPLVSALAVTLLAASFAATAVPQFNFVEVVSSLTSNERNYQVPVTLTPENFDYASAGANGSDLRFVLEINGTCTSIGPPIDHYIESWVEDGTSLVWVRMPEVPIGTSIAMAVYGDGIPGTSSFPLTFPEAAIVGTGSIAGVFFTDWFELLPDSTAQMVPRQPVAIFARVVRIHGDIDGTGMGFAASAAENDGDGPGAGTTSTTAGAGGGSHRGIGGAGGFDAGDVPGVGGPAYGSDTGPDITQGSSGGSGAVRGGAGGGAVRIEADHVFIGTSGSIVVDGEDAPDTGTARLGGGGAGGTIRIDASNLEIHGGLAARGGDGGNGTANVNDSGGGGGGGRIKMLTTDLRTEGSQIVVTGGIGGPFGGQSPGEAGGPGLAVVQVSANAPKVRATLGDRLVCNHPIVFSDGFE